MQAIGDEFDSPSENLSSAAVISAIRPGSRQHSDQRVDCGGHGAAN
jgi:hypothetical protein